MIKTLMAGRFIVEKMVRLLLSRKLSMAAKQKKNTSKTD